MKEKTEREREVGRSTENTQQCSIMSTQTNIKQGSPAIVDKPARRESLPKIAPIRRAYNVVADKNWPIFIRLAVVASEICEIPRNSLKIQTYGVQGHRSWCQWKAHL